MKIKRIVSALTLATIIGVGGTVYAATTNTNQNAQNVQTETRSNGLGMRRSIGVRGRDIVDSVAKDKFKISEEEIAKAREEGKTLYDLLKEKGIDHDAFKSANIEAKNKAIDEAVASNKLTKEEGDTLKAAVKEKSDSAVPGEGKMTGKNGAGNGQGNGQGKGAGNGQGQGNNGECEYQ